MSSFGYWQRKLRRERTAEAPGFIELPAISSRSDWDREAEARLGDGVRRVAAAGLRGREFVYIWADGIYVNVRSDQRRCVLAVVGCDVRGNKHFLAIEEGFRESTESWRALLLSLRDRGIEAPQLAIGDGGSNLTLRCSS